MQDTVFIVGADSNIGAALEAGLHRRGYSVIGTTRRLPAASGRIHLDLSEAPDRWQLPDGCAVTYLLAGVTSLAQCETEPELTRRINVDHTVSLAGAMAARGSHVVFLSTNLVLSGTTPDAPTAAKVEPQCAYARQKAEVEDALLNNGISASILRITKLAETLVPLLSTWATELTAGRPIAPFSDLVCAPLGRDDLIEAMLRLGEARKTGLFHIGARPDISYDDIAKRLAHSLGVAEGLVRPTTSVAAGVTLLANPPFTTLNTSASEVLLGLSPLQSDTAIDAVLADVHRVTSDRTDRGS